MNMQEHILTALRELFNRWGETLATLSTEQITAPNLPTNWSVKDEIAHLWAWQQRSIARLQAALSNREPVFPQWDPHIDPEDYDNTDPINAWIYEAYREQPWPRVHQNWREGFLRFLELGAQISEKELLDAGRYTWLDDLPLAAILLGSYDHHQEHLDFLLARLSQQVKSGLAEINGAQIYYEIAGEGPPLVMIHAGVADSRQWNHEFAYFAQGYRVVRYDMRGYGRSEPVDGEFSHMGDLIALIDHLEIHQPLVLMGCSMGGGLAMDFALAHPSRVRALIMVGSGPSGLELEALEPAKFAEAEKAYQAGDLDLAAEIETQIWFDGIDRAPKKVNPAMHKLAYEMDRLALSHEVRKLGKRLPNSASPAVERLAELNIPVLVIVGAQDIPYILLAADYMIEKILSARKVVIEDAAHLPNMDHPDEFQRIVKAFLDDLAS